MQRIRGSDSDHQRFWSKVQVVSDSGCWVWIGSCIGKKRTGAGHGEFWLDGRKILAHRAAWEMYVGPIPPGLSVLHKCDNPPCVRPDHLFLGTQLDNMRDCAAKGRNGATRHPELRCGERNPACRLTESDVRQIRERLARGDRKLHIARTFGVSHTLIHYIAIGRLWKSLAT